MLLPDICVNAFRLLELFAKKQISRRVYSAMFTYRTGRRRRKIHQSDVTKAPEIAVCRVII